MGQEVLVEPNPIVFEVGTVEAFRQKLVEAMKTIAARHECRIPIAVESPPGPASGLPTDPVDFPPFRLVVDMRQIVKRPVMV